MTTNRIEAVADAQCAKAFTEPADTKITEDNGSISLTIRVAVAGQPYERVAAIDDPDAPDNVLQAAADQAIRGIFGDMINAGVLQAVVDAPAPPPPDDVPAAPSP